MGRLKVTGIPDGQRVLVDTLAFVYFLEHHPQHLRPAWRLFRRIESGKLTAVASALVLAELLVPLHRTNNPQAAIELARTLRGFPNLSILDASPEICAEAARLRASYGLRTPDAIHGATALAARADGIATNDSGFERLAAENLAIWRFD